MCNLPGIFITHSPWQTKPVCLLYGNFGDTIPIKTIMQDNNTIANSFSPFSEKVMTSTALRKAKTIPMIKMLILQSVVTRKIPILKSSVVRLVNKAKLRYSTIAAISIHIPAIRIDTTSFFTLIVIIIDKNETNRIRPLFWFA